MHLAKKFAVPSDLALLYEFLNSADLRGYIEKGVQHSHSDELETPAQLEAWLGARDLLAKGETVSAADHRRTVELRSAMRSFLELSPESRAGEQQRAKRLNRVLELYPLVGKIMHAGKFTLQPASGASGLGRVVAELFTLADKRRLDRLKMCSSAECQWIFFDRSKPGNRRWCSSLLCGNRQKTRDYRKRLNTGGL
jgi:predicted RNA-binding Zn ribbon-like protein